MPTTLIIGVFLVYAAALLGGLYLYPLLSRDWLPPQVYTLSSCVIGSRRKPIAADVDELAKRHHIVGGKWCLFPSRRLVDAGALHWPIRRIYSDWVLFIGQSVEYSPTECVPLATRL